MRDSQLGQNRITASSLATSLAVGNTMAYIGTYFAETALIQTEFRASHIGAQWGLVLNFVGVALGGYIWPRVSRANGTRYALILSCLLLAICSSLTTTLWSYSGVLLLRLASGTLGSAPLYLYNAVYNDYFGCLMGLNSGLITFALTGGLAWGIVIRLVADEAYSIFFAYSSGLCAICIYRSLDKSPPTHNEGLPRDECGPPKTPLANVGDLLDGMVGLQATCLSCYCFVLYYLVIPSQAYYPDPETFERTLPFCGIVAGSGLASVYRFINIPLVYPKGAKTDPERFKVYDYAGLITGGIALEIILWLLWNIYTGHMDRYYSYALFVVGIMLGVALVEIFNKPVSLRADCHATYPKEDHDSSIQGEYLLVAIWIALACGITNLGGAPHVLIVMNFAVPPIARCLYYSWSKTGQLVIACVKVPGILGPEPDADSSAGPSSCDPTNSGNDIRMQDLERENQELRAKLSKIETEGSTNS